MLFKVLLRWIVCLLLSDLHGAHLTLSLLKLGLLLSFLFFNLFLLFKSKLSASEFFKNVLIVQDSVRKFIFECFPSKELAYTGLDLWHLKDLVNSRTHCWVFLKHILYQTSRCISKRTWKRVVLSSDNFLSELMK